ncbi:MAG TPA: GNAT family N-acetyltransferase, partial [Epsilonproteobacteria bacterium]|nr:GNAT family N-acetyltransferase [Campylobacterota bacterium]
MKIDILSRDESLNIISDPSFRTTWDQLARQTSHCTVIQEYGFVASWYLSYLELFDPMMVLGYDTSGTIIGVLPLAVAHDSGTLSLAGENQAEYHGWVCPKAHEEHFLIQALITIKKELHPGMWQWGWLPPGVDTDWLHAKLLHKNGIYINTIALDSPLHNLQHPEKLEKIIKHKSNKIKINRLKRTGELRIERIRDRNRAEELIETIIDQYNFRHLSLYDNIPFKSDTHKKEWHLKQIELMPEYTHFTVLWHNDELLASNFGYCTDEKVLLGLVSYDPVKGAYSPGVVFLIKLMEFIKEEGFGYLDLTPGGDSYKERYANEHVALLKPSFSFNRYQWMKSYLASRVRRFLKQYLTAKDIATIKNRVKKNLFKLLRRKVSEHTKGLPSYFIYTKETRQVSPPYALPPLKKQQYRDLLLYEGYREDLTCKEIAYRSMKKFERGDRLYTMV